MGAKIKTSICLVILLFLLDVNFFSAFAAMSSSNFKIQSDAIDVGGVPQTSETFFSEDSIGEVGTGEMKSASFNLRAGFQPMQEVYLSISAPPDISMTPNIPGVSGGAGNGEAIWTVATDDLAGYSLYARSSTSPALKNDVNPAYFFADYTPAGAAPDYTWLVASSASEFGFTPEGNDIIQKFRDNGLSCNSGTFDAPDVCWYNFSSSSPGELIAQSGTSNHPSGVATKIKVQAQSDSSHLQEEGSYQATIIVTALAN